MKRTRRKRQTKLQRMNASARASRKRGMVNYATKLLKKANPGLKHVLVSVKRLKGGGLSVIPKKVKK